MQLHLILAPVEPQAVTLPAVCPRPTCDGTEFRLHQQVTKAIKDTMHQTVSVCRVRCLRCGCTFRVYPRGVTHAHTSQQVQDLAVLLYFLGLSFGAVSSVLDAFGVYLSKSRVYAAVQAAKIKRPQLVRHSVFESIQNRHHPAGLYVQCMQQMVPLALMTDACCRLVLTVASLVPTDIATLQAQITPVIAAMAGQVMLVDTGDSHNAMYVPETQPV